jgi:hypothetical protein
MSVCCECCVLSGTGLWDELITRPGESYRVWCVWVWSWILDREEALAYWGFCAKKKERPVTDNDITIRIKYAICMPVTVVTWKLLNITLYVINTKIDRGWQTVYCPGTSRFQRRHVWRLGRFPVTQRLSESSIVLSRIYLQSYSAVVLFQFNDLDLYFQAESLWCAFLCIIWTGMQIGSVLRPESLPTLWFKDDLTLDNRFSSDNWNNSSWTEKRDRTYTFSYTRTTDISF